MVDILANVNVDTVNDTPSPQSGESEASSPGASRNSATGLNGHLSEGDHHEKDVDAEVYWHQSQTQVVKKFSNDESRPFLCQFCKLTFSQKGNLTVHLRLVFKLFI